jgi:hypothetical protein
MRKIVIAAAVTAGALALSACQGAEAPAPEAPEATPAAEEAPMADDASPAAEEEAGAEEEAM